MDKPRIAFFGLGTMGGGMAYRLLGAGYDVTVYSRTAEKAAPFVAKGATTAATPRAAAAHKEILIAMLADDIASQAIWFGDSGALAGAAPGATIIDCSTLTVPWIHLLAADAQKHKCHFIDAPVTGTKPHAANGELTFLAGGTAEDIDRVRPVLAVMSKEVIHMGPVGSGAAMKLVNNFVCGVQAAALAEAFALMERAGLDLSKALPVLLNGAPGSPLLKTLSARHTNKDYTPNFQLKLMAKDLRYAIQEARERKVHLKTAAAALEQFTQAADAGLGDEDLSAVIKYLLAAKTTEHQAAKNTKNTL